jgi:hypothetical protein
MNFRRANYSRSVMFAVNFEDGRTAYFVIENHGGPREDYLVGAMAKERQDTGTLPAGAISNIRRVR